MFFIHIIVLAHDIITQLTSTVTIIHFFKGSVLGSRFEGVLWLSVRLKYPSSLLPEIAGAGGFLQGDQGDLMTPGFPEHNYLNGALYQVRPQTSIAYLYFNTIHIDLNLFISFIGRKLKIQHKLQPYSLTDSPDVIADPYFKHGLMSIHVKQGRLTQSPNGAKTENMAF